MEKQSNTRRVPAPQPTLVGPLPQNRVVDVEVADDEELEWTWTTLAGGQRYVSGYTLRPRRR